MPEQPTDARSAATVVRQYEHLAKIKRDLVRQGLLTGDATPQQVVATLRSIVPPDLWAAK